MEELSLGIIHRGSRNMPSSSMDFAILMIQNLPVAAAVMEKEMMDIRERRSRRMAPRDKVRPPPTLLEDTLEEWEDRLRTPVVLPLMEEESLEEQPVTLAAAPLMEALLEDSLAESLAEQLNILMFSNLTPEAIINFALQNFNIQL